MKNTENENKKKSVFAIMMRMARNNLTELLYLSNPKNSPNVNVSPETRRETDSKLFKLANSFP